MKIIILLGFIFMLFEELSFRDRVHLSLNWQKGIYKEYTFLPYNNLFASKVILNNTSVYISHGSHIREYKRLGNNVLDAEYVKEFGSSNKSDIMDFTIKAHTLFAGRACGASYLFEDGYFIEQRLHNVSEDILCVDFAKKIYVTSSKERCKIWKREDELGFFNLELIKSFETAFKSFKISSSGEKIIGGKFMDHNEEALREVDVETKEQIILKSKTTSIIGLTLIDDNFICTANIDNTLKLFDRRLDEDVSVSQILYTPSSIEHDGCYGILCGMKSHSSVYLYDIRNLVDPVQIYNPFGVKIRGSTVSSLASDCRYLFIITNRALKVFDFKTGWDSCDNYKI